MYNSESSDIGPTAESAGSLCKTPTRHFGINFQPSNDFEKGLGVAIIVDGVLCTSKDAAKTLINKRVDELHARWAAQIEKM